MQEKSKQIQITKSAVDAKLTAAKGKLIEYNKGDKLLTLEACNGSDLSSIQSAIPKQTVIIMSEDICKQQNILVLVLYWNLGGFKNHICIHSDGGKPYRGWCGKRKRWFEIVQVISKTYW